MLRRQIPVVSILSFLRIDGSKSEDAICRQQMEGTNTREALVFRLLISCNRLSRSTSQEDGWRMLSEMRVQYCLKSLLSSSRSRTHGRGFEWQTRKERKAHTVSHSVSGAREARKEAAREERIEESALRSLQLQTASNYSSSPLFPE